MAPLTAEQQVHALNSVTRILLYRGEYYDSISVLESGITIVAASNKQRDRLQKMLGPYFITEGMRVEVFVASSGRKDGCSLQ